MGIRENITGRLHAIENKIPLSLRQNVSKGLHVIGNHIPFQNKIVHAYQASEKMVKNFRETGDTEQVGYGLLVAAGGYGVAAIQGLSAFALMNIVETMHIPVLPLGLLAIGMYAASKFVIYLLNRKMLESKDGWCADYHTQAFRYSGLSPARAATGGIISDLVIGTAVNPVDLTGLGALVTTILTGQENPLAASIFISKSILFPAYYAAANLLIHAGLADPVLKKVKKVRKNIIRNAGNIYHTLRKNR